MHKTNTANIKHFRLHQDNYAMLVHYLGNQNDTVAEQLRNALIAINGVQPQIMPAPQPIQNNDLVVEYYKLCKQIDVATEPYVAQMTNILNCNLHDITTEQKIRFLELIKEAKRVR